MARGPKFIDRVVFDAVMEEQVLDEHGSRYQDLDTAYGDMSRLVVAWLAHTSPEELQKLYKTHWPSVCNVQQCHKAAKAWWDKYKSEDDRPEDS